MSIIRDAKYEDIDEFIQLGKDMAKESPIFDKYGFDEGKLWALIHNAIDSDNFFVCVSFDDSGFMTGMMLAMINEHFFSGDRFSSDLLLYVRPALRGGGTAVKMVGRYIQWAQDQGALEVKLGISTGVNVASTRRFYEGMGFRLTGHNFNYVG